MEKNLNIDFFLKENKLSKDAKKTALVKRVGTKIQKAVEQYMAEKNLSDRLNGYSWEYNLVESDQVNAWCMPGGKDQCDTNESADDESVHTFHITSSKAVYDVHFSNNRALR